MLENREGQRVPDVTFRVRAGHEWVTLSSEALFSDQTVVVLSLPGAFTPTCSSSHLPRYDELAPAFFACGVDRIVCIAVNDPYVMSEWGADERCHNVDLVPDGNAEFTAGMGMLVDRRDLGFGRRSWRYSMLVKDGVIEKMFIEPEKPGDPLEVSDADTMLAYIDPAARKPDRIVVFTRDGCPYCAAAKAELEQHGLDFVELPLPNQTRNKVLGALCGRDSVPQIFINGEWIGGSEALTEHLAERSG